MPWVAAPCGGLTRYDGAHPQGRFGVSSQMQRGGRALMSDQTSGRTGSAFTPAPGAGFVPGGVGRMQEALIGADYRRTAGMFTGLIRDGQSMPELVRHALNVAAPYLTVPSHVMVAENGEYSNVNYDHCVLGLRASRRLLPYLPSGHRQLAMAQAVWYMPQGLDVWDQLLCEFPGHYARDDKKCGLRPGGTDENGSDRFDGPAWNAPKAWFDTDHEPDRAGTSADRLRRLQERILEGDRHGAYRVSLGLRREADPVVRRQLEAQLLFCGIIDLQDTLQTRKLQNIGHKALRARAAVDLTSLIGWDHADPLYYCVVPDLACFPRLYPLFDMTTVTLTNRFKGDQWSLKARNVGHLDDVNRDRLTAAMLHGKLADVTEVITDLLADGVRVIEISDAIIAAFCRHLVDEAWSSKSFFQIGHAFDYSNVVSFWLRGYDHPHQAKAPYFQAAFINDCIQMNKFFPPDPGSPLWVGDPREHRVWADRLPLSECLAQLLAATETLDYPHAGACVESYLSRTRERTKLLRTLVLASSKMQNDPHQQRHAASMVEEWEVTTAGDGARDTMLRAWVKYVAGGAKRTTDLECVRMFEASLGLNSSVIHTPVHLQADRGVMGLTLAKPVEMP